MDRIEYGRTFLDQCIKDNPELDQEAIRKGWIACQVFYEKNVVKGLEVMLSAWIKTADRRLNELADATYHKSSPTD